MLELSTYVNREQLRPLPQEEPKLYPYPNRDPLRTFNRRPNFTPIQIATPSDICPSRSPPPFAPAGTRIYFYPIRDPSEFCLGRRPNFTPFPIVTF
jgi:hypothetical protein